MTAFELARLLVAAGSLLPAPVDDGAWRADCPACGLPARLELRAAGVHEQLTSVRCDTGCAELEIRAALDLRFGRPVGRLAA